jgi:hypothetical protein
VDALNTIVIGMAAIAFGWIGYFIGNFFPVFGKAKKNQMERKAAGIKLIDVQKIREGLKGSQKQEPGSDFILPLEKSKKKPSPIKKTWNKTLDWLLERESTEEEELPVVSPFVAPEPEVPLAELTQSDQPEFYIPESLPIPEDAVVLWHDRRNKKLYSRVGKEIFDIEGNLTKQQHASLSMLLVDLQFKIGLSATLKAALSESTEQVYAEREKKSKLETMAREEAGEQPSFNPVKTFLNYVTADVPKLDDQPESIPNQINAILQGMIKNSPLRERGISVSEWPNRGVVFIVGLEIYDHLEEVPEEEIKAVIKSAVKQWEDSQLEE